MDPNTVLNCFDTEILYYGSKGFWGLCLYDSSTLSLNFFLTCFDIKISHLGSNPYPRLVLLPKWNLGLDLKHKIVLLIWEPNVPIFVPKCYAALIFALKGPYGHRKDCSWTQTQCFNVFKQKYRITVPKVSVDLVYTILLLITQNFFLMFWLQNPSFGSKWLTSACFGHKMKFWFGFET